MKLTRVVTNINKWTFTVKPIKDLVTQYAKDGKGWVDPFAGFNSPAEISNDLNPKSPAKFHMEAAAFCAILKDRYDGVLFDPPYSPRQVKECYEGLGLDSCYKNNSWYNNVRNAICDKIRPGGYAISCGWHSHGFGRGRGFKIIEILLVSSSQGEAYDTIVTVEKKINNELSQYER